MSEWLPMETAPKDGRRILAFASGSRFADGFLVFVTAWSGGVWGSVDSCCGYYEDLEPTHWMPLPEPPR